MKKIILIFSVSALIFLFFYLARELNKNNYQQSVDLPGQDQGLKLYNLLVGGEISSPTVLLGEIPGPWFFEASFPVELRDAENNVLTTSLATAQGDWTKTQPVAFVLPLEFNNNERQLGSLVFIKDNPSGLPEHDDSIIWPVILE